MTNPVALQCTKSKNDHYSNDEVILGCKKKKKKNRKTAITEYVFITAPLKK